LPFFGSLRTPIFLRPGRIPLGETPS